MSLLIFYVFDFERNIVAMSLPYDLQSKATMKYDNNRLLEISQWNLIFTNQFNGLKSAAINVSYFIDHQWLGSCSI